MDTFKNCISRRNKLSRTVVAILIASAQAALALSASSAPAPTPDSGNIAIVVSRLLEQGHYSRQQLNDETSGQLLDFYLDALDYNHLAFYKTDVDEFRQKYGTQLVAGVKNGDVKPAFAIFARYLERVEQRAAYSKSVLSEELTFNDKDSIVVDRHEVPHPADETEARKMWRQWVKHEVLQERLNKEKPEEIVKLITRRYDRMLRSIREFDSEQVLEVYLTALGHVYDPHTDYLAPADKENFDISMKLKLDGIGAVLASEDGYCKVISVVPGGPAGLDKRLKANDRIVAVAQGDGEWVDIVDMSLQKVVEQVRGKKGTEVRLRVIPADAPDPSTRIEIKLVRDEIKLTEQEAKAKVIEVPDGKGRTRRLGYIDLPSFYSELQQTATSKSTTRDVRRLIEHLKTQNIEGLVLDLRRNGGGALNEAINLTGLFIKEGPVVEVKNYDGKTQVYSDNDRSVAYDGPLVVLTSHASASASEIVAGALQDYGRALIIGERSTFGKGTVQSMLEVGRYVQSRDGKQPDWGALKLTIQKFYRVSGGSTQNKGVIPDLQLPSTLDYRKVAETALKNAMPYDEVARARYESSDQITPYVITMLKALSSKRVTADPEFKYVNEDIERLKVQLEQNSVSLNEEKRLAEKNADTARDEARKKERLARSKNTKNAFKITDVSLQSLDGDTAASAPALTKSNLQASAKASGGDVPDEPAADPIFDEGLRILADLARLSSVAAK